MQHKRPFSSGFPIHSLCPSDPPPCSWHFLWPISLLLLSTISSFIANIRSQLGDKSIDIENIISPEKRLVMFSICCKSFQKGTTSGLKTSTALSILLSALTTVKVSAALKSIRSFCLYFLSNYFHQEDHFSAFNVNPF